MAVCGNRTDTPDALTPCASGSRRCVCGDQVAAELINQSDNPEETP